MTYHKFLMMHYSIIKMLWDVKGTSWKFVEHRLSFNQGTIRASSILLKRYISHINSAVIANDNLSKFVNVFCWFYELTTANNCNNSSIKRNLEHSELIVIRNCLKFNFNLYSYFCYRKYERMINKRLSSMKNVILW